MNTIDSPRARQFAWLAIGIYLVGLGISATLRAQGDFNVYYRAGHRVLHGLAIYPPDDSDRFLYAPIFAIGFAPLAALPRHLAQFVFFAVNAFSLIELIIGAGVILFGRERRLPAALIVVPVLLSFRFIDNNIEHGQINLPTLALIVWAIIYADESRDAWAGLMLAAAILIKPFGLLAALHLAIRRHFAALGWAVAAGIALIVVPIVVFGPHGWIDQTGAYVNAIASMTNRYRTMLTNQSAVSAVARLMSLRVGADAETSPTATIVGMGLEIILVAAVSLWDCDERCDRGNFASRLALCGLFCLMPSFTPISWKSYYAAMVVPYMALTAALWTDRTAGESAPISVWTLFALSVLLNLATGNYLNRIALFYSAHFLSSLLALGRRVRIVASKRDRGSPGVRPPSQMKWRSYPNFSAFKIGRRELVIHRDIAPHAAQIMQKLGELASASEAGAGNRESAFRLNLGGGLELFARRGRRGGMIASILSDVYLGMTPRPLTELAVTIEAMRRGIPVAEPMGAMVEWIGPALYRGFFLTRAVRGMTLWEFVKTDDDPTVRGHVLGQARAAIDTMHTKGSFTPISICTTCW